MATVKTFSGADVSLFHVAAREYGNPLAWFRIASANGLVDPMITGSVDLIVPNADPTPPTGLPSS